MSKEAMKLEMVDDEGENQAVRMFLALYGGACGVTAEKMREHLKMAGFEGAWPEWANSHNGNLTKAGAQLWIRHLFALAEQPARQQEPVEALKDEVTGCFNAAFAEGLQEALAETQDERLKDLVERRLMYALYAAQGTSPQPAQRTWVGLTHEEHMEITTGTMTTSSRMAAVEAKLKEKNT